MKKIELNFSFHIKNLTAESQDPPKHSLAVQTHSMSRNPLCSCTSSVLPVCFIQMWRFHIGFKSISTHSS